MGKLVPLLSLVAAVGATLAGAAPSAEAATLSDFPCKGCITSLPDDLDAGPRPLLVALHGDGGGVSKVFQAFQGASQASGAILVALRCPVDLGCPAGSWWQWYFSAKHDPAWLSAQIDAVTARYPVDPLRVYAAGYSGGGTYLGYYGPENPRKFAAIAYVAGGMPFRVPCPSCKLPVLFVIGATDPMVVPYTRPLREYYDACGGHEVVWEALRGVSHEGILDVLRGGKAKEIMTWLLDRPAACTMATVVDAGGGDAGSALEDHRKPGRQEENTNHLPVFPSSSDPSLKGRSTGQERPPPGCGCRAGRGSEDAAVLGALALAFAIAARRRRR